MNFILKISLGLLVLCVLAWSSPIDNVSPSPESKNHTKEQNSPNHQHTNNTTVEVKSTETPTRRPTSKTTVAPGLNHGVDHSSPSKISSEQPTPLPETHESETATVTASKKPEDQHNENDKSSASVHMQMYPFALTSLAVLVFSAI